MSGILDKHCTTLILSSRLFNIFTLTVKPEEKSHKSNIVLLQRCSENLSKTCCCLFTIINFTNILRLFVQLDMPKEHIFANLQTILMDVCSHRPASLGTFITSTTNELNLWQKLTNGRRHLRAAPINHSWIWHWWFGTGWAQSSEAPNHPLWLF